MLVSTTLKEGGVSRCGQLETWWTECIPFHHYGGPGGRYSRQWLQIFCFLTSVSDSSSPVSCHQSLTPVLLFLVISLWLQFLVINLWLQFSWFLSSVFDSSSLVSCHQSLTPVSCHQSLTPVLLILVISLWLQFSCFLSSVFDSSFLSSQCLADDGSSSLVALSTQPSKYWHWPDLYSKFRSVINRYMTSHNSNINLVDSYFT